MPCFLIQLPVDVENSMQAPMKLPPSDVKNKLKPFLAIIAILLFLSLLIFANLRFSRQNNAGLDFFIRWLPTRLILMGELDSPYAIKVMEAAEHTVYGYIAEGVELEGFFLYPYYFLLFMLPFGFISNYLIARVLWMTLLEILIVLLVIISMQIVRFSPRPLTTLLLLLFFLVSPRFLQPIVDANPAVLSAFFVVLALFLIEKEKDIFAGVMLAFSTIKPQLVVLFFFFVLIWAFSRKRWKLIVSSIAGVVLLSGVSLLLNPDWILEFWSQINIYQAIATPNNPSMILPGWVHDTAEIVVNIFVVFSLLLSWRWAYGKSYPFFLWTALFSFCLLPLTSLPFGNRNLVVLVPAIILILATIQLRLQKSWLTNGVLILLFLISWFMFLLPAFWQNAPQWITFVNYLPFVIFLTAGIIFIRKDWIQLSVLDGVVLK